MKQKVIIYGLGKNYHEYRNYLNAKYDIVALTDSDSEIRANNGLLNIPIIDPKSINVYDFDHIILTPSNIKIRGEIKEQLQKAGISSSKFLDLQRYLTIGDFIAQIRLCGAVIYGTGYWAKVTYQILEFFNIQPLCFADGDLYEDDTNSTIDTKINVIPLCQAAEIYPNAVFLNGYDGKIRRLNLPFYATKVNELKQLGVYSEYSSFAPSRYAFLIDACQEGFCFSSPNELKFKTSNVDMSNLFCVNDLKEVIFQPVAIRGGSIMLYYLLCDHPNLMTLPFHFIYFNTFCYAYVEHLRFLSGMPLVLEILSLLNLSDDDYLIDENAWYDENGDVIPRTKVINKELFASYLSQYILNFDGIPDFGYIFKSIHAAYENSKGKRPEQGIDYIIYYHAHTWLFNEVWISRYFRKVSFLSIIREPLRAAFSQWHGQYQDMLNGNPSYRDTPIEIILSALPSLTNCFFVDNHLCYDRIDDSVQTIITDFTYDSDVFELIDYTINNVRMFMEGAKGVFVRFEDLKTNLEGTMRKVCRKFNLPFNEILLTQTQGGIEIFNKGVTNSFFVSFNDTNQLVSAASLNALKPVEYGEHFSSFDIFRLEMIFKKIASYFNYNSEDGIPDISIFNKETLLQLFYAPIKSAKLKFEEDDDFLKKGTLFFMLLSYLQSKIIETFMQASGEESFDE